MCGREETYLDYIISQPTQENRRFHFKVPELYLFVCVTQGDMSHLDNQTIEFERPGTEGGTERPGFRPGHLSVALCLGQTTYPLTSVLLLSNLRVAMVPGRIKKVMV